MIELSALKLKSIKAQYIIAVMVMVLSLVTSIVSANSASAVFNDVLVRFDRMQTSTATTGTVCASPNTAGTEIDVQVVFPTGYAVSTTVGNWTVNTTNTGWPAGATAWLGINTATAAVGQAVTFPSSNLTEDVLYCFNWTNTAAVSTQGSASNANTGTVTTRAAGATTIDQSAYTTSTITDDTIDVTATVPQSFSFAIDNTTDALGSLATGSVTTSPTPRTVTVNTNAQSGWLVWAREDSSNPGLYSAFATKSIDSATPGTGATLSAGTEGYITGLSDTQGSGTGTISLGAYDYDTGTDGAPLDNTLRTVASSNGTAANAVLTIRNQVAIAAITPAATDYTDSITFVGAGLF